MNHENEFKAVAIEAPLKERNDGAKMPPKVFPYLPPQPTDTMLHRMEMMRQLDLWENNNPAIAKRHAESLVLLLIEQFGLKWENVTK